MFTSSLLTVFTAVALAFAIPTPAPVDDFVDVEARASGVVALTASDLSALAPYTQFARVAYCPSSGVKTWKCGDACNSVAGFQPTLTGGDGNAIQLYFVGYWPSQNAVVVSHEGTDPTQFMSILTDIEIPMTNLDSKLFPGVSSNVLVHEGFANQHALTAATILAEVKRLISLHSATTVTLVGHSLGGALAELDSLYMTLNLPSNIHVKGVTYGTPRVGNPAFAQLFDSKVADFQRINNEKDLIPIVPGRGLGFSHVHGEVHIVSTNNAVSCPGDDDATDSQCTISTVPNIFVGNIIDHLGPYQGIFIGTIFCT
ncbi:Alpha/Beta hydrolase protein [Abortiporus biennis]|nr:Alpha/Beta hydrolase protein [Abortiporus biennis]